MQSIAETCVRFDAAHLSINLVSEIAVPMFTTLKCCSLCKHRRERESAKFELAGLEEEEEDKENQYWRFGDFLVWYFRDGFSQHWESSWPGKHSKMDSKLS